MSRLTILKCGKDIDKVISDLLEADDACLQIDFSMSDSGIDLGVKAAKMAGFGFCGWLPGIAEYDVFRMQKVDELDTDLNPGLVNPVAKDLLANYLASSHL